MIYKTNPNQKMQNVKKSLTSVRLQEFDAPLHAIELFRYAKNSAHIPRRTTKAQHFVQHPVEIFHLRRFGVERNFVTSFG